MSKPLYAVSTDTSHVLRCRVRLGLVPPGEKGDKKKGKGNPGAGFSNERADQHAHAVAGATPECKTGSSVGPCSPCTAT